MTTLVVETFIEAPPEMCFDLARDIGFHCQSAGRTGERAIAGRVRGLIELGEWVTFEGVHFGVRQQFTARVVEFETPHFFADEMTRGAFTSLRHEHAFEACNGAALMRDTLIWRAPLGLLGAVADALVLKRHMRKFLETRNGMLKREAEKQATVAKVSD